MAQASVPYRIGPGDRVAERRRIDPPITAISLERAIATICAHHRITEDLDAAIEHARFAQRRGLRPHQVLAGFAVHAGWEASWLEVIWKGAAVWLRLDHSGERGSGEAPSREVGGVPRAAE
jgi:hypothetical protein